MEPRLIIADEPIASWYFHFRRRSLCCLKASERKEVFISVYCPWSVDGAVFEWYSWCNEKREIGWDGTNGGAFGNPCHPYTRSLLSAIHVPDPVSERGHALIEYNEIQSQEENWLEISPGHRVRGESIQWSRMLFIKRNTYTWQNGICGIPTGLWQEQEVC